MNLLAICGELNESAGKLSLPTAPSLADTCHGQRSVALADAIEVAASRARIEQDPSKVTQRTLRRRREALAVSCLFVVSFAGGDRRGRRRAGALEHPAAGRFTSGKLGGTG